MFVRAVIGKDVDLSLTLKSALPCAATAVPSCESVGYLACGNVLGKLSELAAI